MATYKPCFNILCTCRFLCGTNPPVKTNACVRPLLPLLPILRLLPLLPLLPIDCYHCCYRCFHCYHCYTCRCYHCRFYQFVETCCRGRSRVPARRMPRSRVLGRAHGLERTPHKPKKMQPAARVPSRGRRYNCPAPMPLLQPSPHDPSSSVPRPGAHSRKRNRAEERQCCAAIG
jgi:hypothetical protein